MDELILSDFLAPSNWVYIAGLSHDWVRAIPVLPSFPIARVSSPKLGQSCTVNPKVYNNELINRPKSVTPMRMVKT